MPVAMRVEYADVLFIPGSLTMSISNLSTVILNRKD